MKRKNYCDLSKLSSKIRKDNLIMFGYVVINKPELKIKDYDKYQEYYCGLCQSLKQNHGRRGQLTLNYDLNFVGILLSSLYEPHENHYFIHCPIHPFHKKRVCTNECMDYVSDMTIILTYYKLEDDILDENSLKSKSLIQFIKKKFKIVKNKYPQKVETIKEHLDQIHYLEQTNCMDLDKIAGHFGHIMAEICVYQEDIFKDDLYQMGFYLGKFIYLIDAFEDVEEDLKKQAEKIAEELKTTPVEFMLNTGKDGQAFGSVSSKQIAEALNKKGIIVDKRKIHMDIPVSSIGTTRVKVDLYKGQVIGEIVVEVRPKG